MSEINQQAEIMGIEFSENAPKLRHSLRKDLTENAFRRYENLIAMACVKNFTLTPSRYFQKQISPTTFVARFNDAKRAFVMFKYSSKVIPKGFNVGDIKAKVTECGMRVWIWNEAYERMKFLEQVDPSLLAKQIAEDESPVIEVDLSDPKMQEFAREMQEAQKRLEDEIKEKGSLLR